MHPAPEATLEEWREYFGTYSDGTILDDSTILRLKELTIHGIITKNTSAAQAQPT